jgi:hypothetical protein
MNMAASAAAATPIPTPIELAAPGTPCVGWLVCDGLGLSVEEVVVRLLLGLGIPELALTIVVEVIVEGPAVEALELAEEVIVLRRVDPEEEEDRVVDDDDALAVSLAWRRILWLSVG